MRDILPIKLVINSVEVPGTLDLSSRLNIDVIDQDLITTYTVINDQPVTVVNQVGIKRLDDNDQYVDFEYIKTLKIPHNEMMIMLWRDPVDQVLVITPELNAYYDMTYLDNYQLDLNGYRVTFGDVEVSNIPSALPTANPTCLTVNIPSVVKNYKGGMYFERMITSNLNYSHPSIYAHGIIDLGKPSEFFSSIGFPAEINVLGYSSLFEFKEHRVGTRKLEDIGHLIIKLPM